MFPSSNLTKAPLEVTHDGTSGEQQFVLQGLKASTSYILQLTVNNSAGFSPPSVVVSFTTSKGSYENPTPKPSLSTVSSSWSFMRFLTTSKMPPITISSNNGQKTSSDDSRALILSMAFLTGVLLAVFVVVVVYAVYRKKRQKSAKRNTARNESNQDNIEANYDTPENTMGGQHQREISSLDRHRRTSENQQLQLMNIPATSSVYQDLVKNPPDGTHVYQSLTTDATGKMKTTADYQNVEGHIAYLASQDNSSQLPNISVPKSQNHSYVNIVEPISPPTGEDPRSLTSKYQELEQGGNNTPNGHVYQSLKRNATEC